MHGAPKVQVTSSIMRGENVSAFKEDLKKVGTPTTTSGDEFLKLLCHIFSFGATALIEWIWPLDQVHRDAIVDCRSVLSDELLSILEKAKKEGKNLERGFISWTFPITVNGESTYFSFHQRNENDNTSIEYFFHNNPEGRVIKEMNCAQLLQDLSLAKHDLHLPASFFQTFKINYDKTVKGLQMVRDWFGNTIAGRMTVDEVNRKVSSIRLFSNLPPEEAQKVAFHRDFTHVPDQLKLQPSEVKNKAVLGTYGSEVRINQKHLGPTDQVCVLQEISIQDGIEQKNVSLFSVPAPALDVVGQQKEEALAARPEMATYIDFGKGDNAKPTFNEKNYQLAHENIGRQIVQAAKYCGANRVVLSAFGVGAFLNALRDMDKKNGTVYAEAAQGIAANALADTIVNLSKSGIEVVFSDQCNDGKFASQDYWNKVNERVGRNSQLNPVNGDESALGKGWVNDGYKDMIVNAWDPDSLVGNGLGADPSFDGWVGRLSDCHIVHAAACAIYNAKNNPLTKQ